jgi:hypothetical protein
LECCLEDGARNASALSSGSVQLRLRDQAPAMKLLWRRFSGSWNVAVSDRRISLTTFGRWASPPAISEPQIEHLATLIFEGSDSDSATLNLAPQPEQIVSNIFMVQKTPAHPDRAGTLRQDQADLKRLRPGRPAQDYRRFR